MLFLYGSIASWYTISIPPGEGVDEVAHLDYVLFLKEQQRLPVQDPVYGRIDAIMGHHPPLFYALGASVIAPIDTSNREEVLWHNPHFVWSEGGRHGWNVVLPDPNSHFPWSGTILALYILRFLNVLFGGVSLFLIYLSARLLFPSQPLAPFGTSALIGLNPAFIYICSIVHHDALLVMLSSAGLYWSIRYAARPVTLSALWSIGILIGGSIVTKVSGIVLVPTVMFVLLLRKKFRQEWKNRFAQILLIATISVLVCGWWFVRNQLIYGDLLGANVYTQIFHGNMRQTPFTWGLFEQEFLAQLYRTSWGAFGFMHILMPVWIQNVMWSITGIAIGGWLIVLMRWLFQRFTISIRIIVGWLAAIFFFIAIFGFYVRVAATTLGAGHGRYLFPAGVTIGAILFGGLSAYIPRRYQQWSSLGIVFAMTLYAVIAPSFYVWPKYSIPESVPEAELEQATRINAVFEGGVTLVAAKSSSAIAIPGQSVDITTYWIADHQKSTETKPDIYVQMSLVNDKPELFATAAFWPEISTTPDVWGDRIVANTQTFYFAANQTPGSLLVQVEVTAGKEGKRLPPINSLSAQIPLLELVTLGEIVEVSASMLPERQRQEVFAETLKLVAAHIPESISVGNVLPVILYWQAIAQIEQDYTVFVHIRNQDGKIVAQLDRPPGGGTSPTSSWQPGQLLQDTYPVLLPDALPPGEYQVHMGLYTWPDMSRQSITNASEQVGDSLLLDTFLLLSSTP
jgi:4-amino-4-deoxy-L-arabinose transferase-like glycosyltransferase